MLREVKLKAEAARPAGNATPPPPVEPVPVISPPPVEPIQVISPPPAKPIQAVSPPPAKPVPVIAPAPDDEDMSISRFFNLEDDGAPAPRVISLEDEDTWSPHILRLDDEDVSPLRIISLDDEDAPPMRIISLEEDAPAPRVIDLAESPPARVVELPPAPPPVRVADPPPVQIASPLPIERPPTAELAPAQRILLNDNGDLASIARAVEEIAAAKTQRDAAATPTLAASALASALNRDGELKKGTLMALLGLSAIVVVAIIVAIFPYVYGLASRRNVPDIVGQQVNLAKTMLSRMGYQVNIAIFDVPNAPAGTVFDVTPAVGTIVHVGDTLTLLVVTDSPSPQPQQAVRRPAPLPTTGLHPATASANPTAVLPTTRGTPKPTTPLANGQPGTSTVRDTKLAPVASISGGGSGTVPGSNPAAASPGAGTVTVPEVKGLNEDRAKALLALLGLHAVTANVTDPTQPNGMVLTCHPGAGTLLASGSNVYLLINSLTPVAPKPEAPPTVVLKNYVGKSGREVTTDLYSLGFTLVFDHQANSTVQPNTVIATDPPAGAAVPVGAVIKVMLAL